MFINTAMEKKKKKLVHSFRSCIHLSCFVEQVGGAAAYLQLL